MEITKICNDCGKIFKGEICPKCGAHYKIEEKENNDPKFQNKKDNRNKINEDYGFTNEEIIKLYNTEAKQADKVYKAFITNGVSRIEKVNGRFLASQLIKLDVLNQQNNRIIEQNDEIIDLLKEIRENRKKE